MKLCLFIPYYLITPTGFDKQRWVKALAGNICESSENISPLADLVSTRIEAGERDEICVDVSQHPDWQFLADNPYVLLGRCNYMVLTSA